jgi:hypothetical protein
VIDISAHGSPIETVLPSIAWQTDELQIERGDQLTAIRGRVVRCTVARVLASRVSYQGAIGFEQPLGWLITPASQHEYSVPGVAAADGVRR